MEHGNHSLLEKEEKRRNHMSNKLYYKDTRTGRICVVEYWEVVNMISESEKEFMVLYKCEGFPFVVREEEFNTRFKWIDINKCPQCESVEVSMSTWHTLECRRCDYCGYKWKV
jgi:hypothetical protein